MLTLTSDAAIAIKSLTNQPGLPDDTGLRIATTEAGDGGQSLAAEIAPSPMPADQVVEADGARVFLDEQAATALDDKALDARQDDTGQVSFEVTTRQG